MLIIGAILSTLLVGPAAASPGGPPAEETTTWFFTNQLAGGAAAFSVAFGDADAESYLSGDWDGSGVDGLAVRSGRLYRQYDLQTGTTTTVSFGRSGDEVFVGDWDGNGTDTLAVRRGNVFLASSTGRSGVADIVFSYGRAGDEVFVGDWDGNGTDTLAVRRGNRLFVRNSVTTGPADMVLAYGRLNDAVLVGDFDGDGTDTFMVRRGKEYHVRNDLRSGPASISFSYGRPTDQVTLGDWDGDGKDTAAVRRVGVPLPNAPSITGARFVGHYGSSATPLLGVLGEGTVADSARRVAARAAAWAGFGLPTVPVAEFIATIANASPGPHGDWSVRIPHNEIRPYIEAMRSVGGITVLDLQPGQSDFLTQAKEYEALLREPDVHLALDPEWRMQPGQIPAQVIGSVDASEINAVTAWLDDLVATNELPPKLVIVHQFTPFMVTNRDRLAPRDNLTMMVHIDGFGSPEAKVSRVNELRPTPPILLGFKLFLDEDTRVMTPAEVIERLSPDPIYVSYQ